MKQIKKKEYFSRYNDYGYPNDVLLIGINYNPKTREIDFNSDMAEKGLCMPPCYDGCFCVLWFGKNMGLH